MRILILGGTGFVGSFLKQYFEKMNGYQVNAFGREAFRDDFDLPGQLNESDLLIMLAGANIGKRWTKTHLRELWESRIETNRALQTALNQCSVPPKRIFSASAIGIYPESSCDQPFDESCIQTGENELGKLGKAWEKASNQLKPAPVIMRFGVVLGKNGGALQKMLLPFKLGLGGPVAGGQQCFSWIHIEDLAEAINFLIQHPEIQGPINLTAPNPVNNKVFGKTLATQLSRPFLIPLPKWQLKLMFGKGAMVLTHSSAIIPSKLLEAGFRFRYAKVDSALKNLLNIKSA